MRVTRSDSRPSALILSGGGRFSDPWHDFPGTTARIADIIRDSGFNVTITDDIEAGLADLAGVDLLVTNMGDPRQNGPAPEAAAENAANLASYIAIGGPILALHISSWAFPDDPGWTDHIGCRWITGTSSHPDNGPSHIHVETGRHPIVDQVGDFDLIDERYCFLDLAGDVDALASHHLYDSDHPLLWARTHNGARVVYSALGHSVDSYDSPEQRTIIGQAARWLVGNAEQASQSGAAS
ncbi:ThuA domain-containing protein [soil metagenome]